MNDNKCDAGMLCETFFFSTFIPKEGAAWEGWLKSWKEKNIPRKLSEVITRIQRTETTVTVTCQKLRLFY